jgi:hypothetical protein
MPGRSNRHFLIENSGVPRSIPNVDVFLSPGTSQKQPSLSFLDNVWNWAVCCLSALGQADFLPCLSANDPNCGRSVKFANLVR